MTRARVDETSYVTLTTYKDLIEHAIDFLGGNVIAQRDAKRAVLDAYREFMLAHQWSYLYSYFKIVTNASYNTGTIAYVHTGSANERELTLTSGTWPTWAASGYVVISNQAYKVSARISSTILQLSVNNNPGADVASGTSYTLFQDTYPLPFLVLSMDNMCGADNAGYLVYCHPREAIEMKLGSISPAQPACFTVVMDPMNMGGIAVRLSPPPDNLYQYDVTCHRRPRPLIFDDYATGTVSVTGTAITGSGTAFTSAMVGSVIRVSANATDPPTSLIGATPYADERVITAFTSATSLTVDSAFTNALTGVKYSISDPVDIEDGVMLVAFKRCVEKMIDVSKRSKTSEKSEQIYRAALMQAREADARHFGRQSALGLRRYGKPLRSMPLVGP